MQGDYVRSMDDTHTAPEEVLAALARLDSPGQIAMLRQVLHEMIAEGVPALDAFCAVAGIYRRLRRLEQNAALPRVLH